jgi:hypothetical protein
MCRELSVVGGRVLVSGDSRWKGYQVSKLALSVDSAGVVRELDLTDNNLSLSKMQEAVGGLVQPVGITDNLVMWVNEEFVFKPELEPNTIATAFFEAVGGSYAIHGTVLFTGGLDEDGYSDGLDNSSRDKLYAISGALDSMVQQMFGN